MTEPTSRPDRALRKAACRDALVAWLYEKDAVSASMQPVVDQMADDPHHGVWHGQAFTIEEIDAAAGWLERQGMIKGPRVDGRDGPVRAYLLDFGATCVEEYGSDTDKYTKAQRHPAAQGPTVNISGGNSGHFQVAGDDAQQVQNIGASVEQIRSLMSGIAEIIRLTVPDYADDAGKTEIALGAVSSQHVDQSVLRRFCQRARSAASSGASSGVTAVISSATTTLLMQAEHLATQIH
jgi:hypothetical protein